MQFKSLKTQALSFLVVTLFMVAPSAEAATDLRNALQQTISSNPNILADEAAARSDLHVINQASAGYFPTLNVRAVGGYEHTRSKFKRNECSNSDVRCTQDKFRTSPGATLVQPVFDGFRTKTNVNRARAEYIQSEKKADETRELLAFRASNAFNDVRRFQRLVNLAEQNVKAHQRILNQVNKLIDGGRASVADRYNVQSRLSDAKAAVVDLQGDLDSAVARYNSLVGSMPDRLGSSKVPSAYLPSSMAEAVNIAREKNRSVILARSSIDVAEAELNASTVPFWPTFSIEANSEQNRNTSGRQGYTDSTAVLGVLRYNIYRGGADAARTAEVAEIVAEQNHRLQAARRVAEQETRRSWEERDSAMRQANELRQSVISKDKVRQAFSEQYELGQRTLVDLLDAENEYFLSKGSLITVDSTQDLTEARLLAAMGVLVERFGLAGDTPDLLSTTKQLSEVSTDTAQPIAVAKTDSRTEYTASPLEKNQQAGAQKSSQPYTVAKRKPAVPTSHTYTASSSDNNQFIIPATKPKGRPVNS